MQRRGETAHPGGSDYTPAGLAPSTRSMPRLPTLMAAGSLHTPRAATALSCVERWRNHCSSDFTWGLILLAPLLQPKAATTAIHYGRWRRDWSIWLHYSL